MKMNKVFTLGLASILGILPILNTQTAIAQIKEDSLDFRKILPPWGANNWPYNEVVDIQDSLTDKVLGKVIIDHHGVAGTPVGGGLAQLITSSLMKDPFKEILPHAQVFISLWGSRVEGCFVDYILQYAASSTQSIDLNTIIPTLLEIQVGEQTIELPPLPQITEAKQSYDYSYEISDNNNKKSTVQSKWYMTRNAFVIDGAVASVLRNAPAGEVRTRLTLANGERLIVPIGENTVSQWKDAYSFNPSCLSPQEAKRQSQIVAKLSLGLQGTLQSYNNSEAQNKALAWLQSNLPAETLNEFSKKWRNTNSDKAQALVLVDVAKFYRGSLIQDTALKWLQTHMPKETLTEFISRWYSL
jgi:hypothetical protein